jgi:hypothetical protein
MQTADINIAVSPLAEQEQIKILERRLRTAVRICVVMLGRLESTDDEYLSCEAGISNSEKSSIMTNVQS